MSFSKGRAHQRQTEQPGSSNENKNRKDSLRCIQEETKFTNRMIHPEKQNKTKQSVFQAGSEQYGQYSCLPHYSCIDQKGKSWDQGWEAPRDGRSSVWNLFLSSSAFSLAKILGFTALLWQQALLTHRENMKSSSPSLLQIGGLHPPTWTIRAVSYQLMIVMLIKTY